MSKNFPGTDFTSKFRNFNTEYQGSVRRAEYMRCCRLLNQGNELDKENRSESDKNYASKHRRYALNATEPPAVL